jgi:hypothetical protein
LRLARAWPPDRVCERAKERQRREMGTLGSGNHYLEVQVVAEIFRPSIAKTRKDGLNLRVGKATRDGIRSRKFGYKPLVACNASLRR